MAPTTSHFIKELQPQSLIVAGGQNKSWKVFSNFLLNAKRYKLTQTGKTCNLIVTQIKCSQIIFEVNSDRKWIWQKYFKKILNKNSENYFIFLPAFYLNMWVMKASKNWGKTAFLKIWELISLGSVKTDFGKLALKWCIFWNEKNNN